MPSNPISVAIIVKNGMPHIKKCVESITFTKDIHVILGSDSNDGTREYLLEQKISFQESDWLGFGKQSQLVTTICSNDWVLKLDSDEELSADLNNWLAKFSPENNHNIYTLKRKNYINDHWVKYGGWWPDRTNRLFNRTVNHFTDSEVHEKITGSKINLVDLDLFLIHHPYENIEGFMLKVNYYSNLRAKDYLRAGKKPTPLGATLHGLFAFFQCYFLKKGFLDGYWGLMVAYTTGSVSFLKYMKVIEANRKNE